MDRTESLKQVTDAVDLIRMLEHLTDNYARGNSNVNEVPWAGIRLTLAQSREILSLAKDRMSRGAANYDSRYDNAPQQGPALADRAPQGNAPQGGGRMRELLNNSGNVTSGARTTAGKVSGPEI